jgi:endonuclease/exonuclease/phosphatase family metal-dependent hydrolase
MNVRIGTFNLENLIRRFDFSNRGRGFNERYEEREILISDIDESKDYVTIKSAVMLAKSDIKRQLTAQVIADLECDILCMQEIDDRWALDNFNKHYISKARSRSGREPAFKWYRLLEGNDPRGIDLGLLSIKELRPVTRSHAHHTFDSLDLYADDRLEGGHINPSDRVFRRDCLEAEFEVSGQPLTLFVCHFKSQAGGGWAKERNDGIRSAEARAVRKIIEAKFDDPANANWIILGDLNESAWTTKSIDRDPRRVNLNTLELAPLLDGFAHNAIEQADKMERWTHYYAADNKYSQLDYILVSPKIHNENPNMKVEIIRAGLPYRAGGDPTMHDHTTVIERYPGVGIHRPKASDHCAMVVELAIGD